MPLSIDPAVVSWRKNVLRHMLLGSCKLGPLLEFHGTSVSLFIETLGNS